MIMCGFQFSVYSVFLAFLCLLGLLYSPAHSINAIVYHHNNLIKLKSNVEVNV